MRCMGVRVLADTTTMVARGRLAAMLAALLAAVLATAAPALASSQPVLAGPPVTVDGPSASIVGVGGLAIARDGSGALVYLKKDASSVAHIFVSRLVKGSFQPPEQIDTGLAGPSSEPVLAAGQAGLLLIGFINGGELYAVDRASSSGAYSRPIGLFAGAAHPSLQMTTFGKAYLAFTADAAGGSHDVRAAYYYRSSWALEPTALDALAADDAGTGAGRPQVAVAGDGVGIVVWGEGGHIYSRRVWGTSPSVVYEQADPPSLSGWSEVGADQPVAGTSGNSSYVDVAFHEVLSSGAPQQSRVLMRRLRGSQYDPVTEPDGLSTPGPDGAEDPQIASGEYGSGVVTSQRQAAHQTIATVLTGSGVSGASTELAGPSAVAPTPVPAIAGLSSDFVAFEHSPGGSGLPEIDVRYSGDQQTFGPPQTVSSPLLGPAVAAAGLAAAGDIDGNAAVAFVQGVGSSTRVVAGQLYRPPGSFATARAFQYSRTHHPLLRWRPARSHWGPLRYTVTVDGVPAGQTNGTALTVARSLSDGLHHWRVTATNPAGEQSATRNAKVWVDTVAPAATVRLSGRRRAGAKLQIRVIASDTAPPASPATASGIAHITVYWGDRTRSMFRGRKAHVYAKHGRYKLTVVVSDRAGNRTKIVRYVVIHR